MVVTLAKKRISTILSLRVGDVIVEMKPVAKYLGVLIHTKMSFFYHIRHTSSKAATAVTAFSRLVTNMGGLRTCKRRLLMTVVQTVLLYGTEVWEDALNKKVYRKRLAQC